MRSPTQGPLSAIRARIEPEFKKAMDAENAKYGLKAGDKNAVSMELVWFGDRPAYQRPHYNDIAMQALWQASKTAGIDVIDKVPERAARSMTTSPPQSACRPSTPTSARTPAVAAATPGYRMGHPGNGVDEGKRVYRFLMMGLCSPRATTSPTVRSSSPTSVRWATEPLKKCSR